MANNISLILLTVIWMINGNFKTKFQKLKEAQWIRPFLIYYLMLLIGMAITYDVENGLFTLNKKITFLILPIIIATGINLDKEIIGFLKRSFVYSCICLILICLGSSALYFFQGGNPENFDFATSENFKAIHPNASPIWMHFSYIQLAHWAGIHPGYLSMYLVFCLIFLLTDQFRNVTDRTIHVLLGILIVCFIVLLATRMAILALICSTAYLLLNAVQKKQPRIVVAIGVVFLALLLLLLVNPVAKFRIIEEPRITTYQVNQAVTNWNSVSYRLLEWEGSWSVIRDHWLIGVGTGGGKLAMDNFYAHFNKSTVGLEHNAHNQYLQTWMETGILGLFTFLACIFLGLFRLRKDPSYVCFIIIFSLMCMTESIGERQKGVVFFTVFQVLFLGFESRKE
jgi:hypothetical protein